MASRCCGSRLSLPNQYDTKTPRASLSVAAARRPRCFSGLFVARPEIRPGPSRVTNHIHSVGLEISLEKFPNFRQRKISKNSFRAFPNAGLCLPNLGQVLENVTSAEGKPQVVLKYRFHSGTRRLSHFWFRATRQTCSSRRCTLSC